MNERDIYIRESYTIWNELNQKIILENELEFAFHGKYVATRAWKKGILLLSETLDYSFYGKCSHQLVAEVKREPDRWCIDRK